MKLGNRLRVLVRSRNMSVPGFGAAALLRHSPLSQAPEEPREVLPFLLFSASGVCNDSVPKGPEFCKRHWRWTAMNMKVGAPLLGPESQAPRSLSLLGKSRGIAYEEGSAWTVLSLRSKHWPVAGAWKSTTADSAWTKLHPPEIRMPKAQHVCNTTIFWAGLNCI